MRKLLGLVVLVAVLLVGVWLVVGTGTPAAPVAGEPREQRAAVTQVERPRAGSAVEREARAERIRERAAERAAMQRRIHEALQARASATTTRRVRAGDGDADAGATARKQAAPAGGEEAAPGQQMIDRTGNHAYLTRVMSQDLIPLADECYELAREQQPDLAGMLVLDVEILGDEEVGGVVDTIATGAANEIKDPGLMECVRESLLATTLPPPEQGGRDAISLSMRFAPDPPAE